MLIKRFCSGAGGVATAVGLAAAAACAPLSVEATVAEGTLTVTGTAAADVIVLRLATGEPSIVEVDVGDDGTADHRFDRGSFSRIQVMAGDGDDVVTVDQRNGAFADETTTIDGGTGHDVLVGGDGNESLIGGIGADRVDGNRGADRADLGRGDDSFTWDPGDGSDVVDGGIGLDTLAFNGAPVDENVFVEAEGSRAVLTRNVGRIRMDLDGVESLSLTLLGGFDNFSIGNFLGNTSLNHADVDLSGPAGGSDGTTDSVNLQGSPDVDHITVGAAGGRIDVAGTAVTTSITGSSLPDQLQIAAEDPGDTIVVDPAVNDLIFMLINPHV